MMMVIYNANGEAIARKNMNGVAMTWSGRDLVNVDVIEFIADVYAAEASSELKAHWLFAGKVVHVGTLRLGNCVPIGRDDKIHIRPGALVIRFDNWQPVEANIAQVDVSANITEEAYPPPPYSYDIEEEYRKAKRRADERRSRQWTDWFRPWGR